MRRILTFLASGALVIGLSSGPAWADESHHHHHHHHFEHRHSEHHHHDHD